MAFCKPAASSARISSIEDTPPLTVKVTCGKAACNWTYSPVVGPCSMPSRPMSVTIASRSSRPAKRLRMASSDSGASSCQPFTATRQRPSVCRTSAPRIMREPQRSSHSSKRSGCKAATLPMMACDAPASNTRARSSDEAIPPPHSSSHGTAAAICSSTDRLHGLEAFAPSRSTRWMRCTPQSA